MKYHFEECQTNNVDYYKFKGVYLNKKINGYYISHSFVDEINRSKQAKFENG